MKIILSLLLFVLPVTMAFSQEINEIKIDSEIEEVTVFVTGGEVYRKTSVPVKKGRNKIVFKGISTVADHKSVQFNADQDYNLVSVSAEIDYLSFVEANPRIKVLQDSMELIRTSITELQNERSAYQEEKNLLLKNNKIKGDTQTLTVQELKDMATYYRTRIMELNKLNTKYDKQINEKNQWIFRYQSQLTELNYQETIKSNQIIVIVDAESATTLNVDLKYIVSNCGWQANYDLLADDLGGDITIKYKAKVYNNTGNDWNKVNVVLSTSDPNVSASAPTLYPWYLNYSSLQQQQQSDFDDKSGYVVPTNRRYKQYFGNSNEPVISQNLDGVLLDNSFGWDGNAEFQQPKQNVNFQAIEVSQLTTEFKIEKQYTIPSDSKPYLVEITEHNLNSTFTYKSVPKLDKDAFLLANIVGWEKLDLVPGPTNVYFADNYVGQSYINTANVEDTLRLSFGRDKKIAISRKLLEEFSDKKVVGSNRKDSYTYEITLKNNRSEATSVDLFDQVPISQDSDISVSVDETSEGKYNELTGIVKWKVNLAPGESKKYKIGFTIKYPKDKKIKVKNYRKVYAPKF